MVPNMGWRPIVDGPIIDHATGRRQPNPERPVTVRAHKDPAAVLPLTHVAYHVLLVLATESRHGYGIIKDIAERTGGRVELEAGTLYAAVKRMKEEGWIKEAPASRAADTRRRTYSISKFGREVLLAESRRLEAMVKLARDSRILPGTTRAKA